MVQVDRDRNRQYEEEQVLTDILLRALMHVPAQDIGWAYIPQYFLFGRQRRDEYTKKSMTWMDNTIKNEGAQYLDQNPVASVVIYDAQSQLAQLVLIDGHTKARLAPKYGIRELPGKLVMFEDLVQYTNVAPHVVFQAIENGVAEAFDSFRNVPQHKNPHNLQVEGQVETVQDIARQFKPYRSQAVALR